MPMPNRSRTCRPPNSKKFAHPCPCWQQNNPYHISNQQHLLVDSSQNVSEPTLPPMASSIHLYDPPTRRCLPTSRIRDMLLKDCQPPPLQPSNIQTKVSYSQNITGFCYFSDLVCDPRCFRCVCKPSFQLFYAGDRNNTSFGCVPIATANQSGIAPCKPGQFYNTYTRECQKIFDPCELPSGHSYGQSGTQFSFISIVLVWVLLLILIFVAKLRKLRGANIYATRRGQHRYHRSASSPNRNRNRIEGSWFHPFMTAINGHPYLTSNHSTEHGNFMDTDFFLGGRRFNEALNPEGNLSNSEQSINTLPPPKFEEIYPNSPITEPRNPPPPPPPMLSNEDLPTYDEAMRLQNTAPPDSKQET